MIIKFFHKSINQSKFNMSVTEAISETFYGNSFDNLVHETASISGMYRAVRRNLRDFGEGHYFVTALDKKYVFAFVSPDFSKATIIHKVSKQYIEQTFKTERRSDKTWIYEVDTMSSDISDDVCEAVINHVDTVDLAELSKEELINIINLQHKALKSVSKTKIELEQAKEEIVLKDEHIAEVERKSSKHFAKLCDARQKNKTLFRMIETQSHIAEASVDGKETVSRMINAEAMLSTAVENFGYETLEAFAEIDGMK